MATQSETKHQTARYYNANFYACAVVAVAQFFDGELFDWTAYMGGCDADVGKQEAIDFVARNGDKLSYNDATYFFPDLPANRYRG